MALTKADLRELNEMTDEELRFAARFTSGKHHVHTEHANKAAEILRERSGIWDDVRKRPFRGETDYDYNGCYTID